MSESGNTKGWFALGMGLIILGAAIYGILMFFGLSLAMGQAASETGAPLMLVLFIPGLVLLGFVVLLAKVIVDRVGNAEDDHYSKHVDK